MSESIMKTKTDEIAKRQQGIATWCIHNHISEAATC